MNGVDVKRAALMINTAACFIGIFSSLTRVKIDRHTGTGHQTENQDNGADITNALY